MNDIKMLIYNVRDRQIILDKDVAYLYGYETKKINQAVKRNINRFPERFCFQLTSDEYDFLRSQNGTLKNIDVGTGKHRKYLPYCFTEQGIAMLSGMLKNEIAVEVSVNIMDAFVEMKKFITANSDVFRRLITVEYKLLEYDSKFDQIIRKLESKEQAKEKLFYNGQIYDAYNLIINILNKAVKEILIIDNYINNKTLEIISSKQVGVDVVLIGENNILKGIDIQKFNAQYGELKIIKSNKFHDRFIIIDRKELYHIGASIKDLGTKCFGITKIEDTNYFLKLLDIVKINDI